MEHVHGWVAMVKCYISLLQFTIEKNKFNDL